jgi:hypothetical protein
VSGHSLPERTKCLTCGFTLSDHVWSHVQASSLCPIGGEFNPAPSLDKPQHSAETGACMCTSFRWDTRTGFCLVCFHVSHDSRVYCGALR